MNTLTFDNKEYVVVDKIVWQGLVDIAEDRLNTDVAIDLIERINNNDEERIPAEVINRLYLDDEPRLRVWREYRGFSGRKLAKAVGISSAYLSDIENGKKDGSISVIKRIAEVLNVDIDDIV